MLIIFINQIDYHLGYNIFILWPAFGNHQRQGNQRIVTNPLSSIFRVKNTVNIKELDKQKGPDPLIAVDKRMVFNDKIKEMCAPFFNARIQFFTAECLINSP